MKIQSLNILFENARIAFVRFPLVIVSAIVAAIAFGFYIEASDNQRDMASVLVPLLGLPLFLSIQFWSESNPGATKNRKLFLTFLGIAFLTGYYFFLKANDTYNAYVQYIHLSLIIHLLVSFVAYLHSANDIDFWLLNKNILIRILFSFVYAAVLYIGLMAAVQTSSVLFSFKVPNMLFGHLWAVAAFIFQTWHFLAGLPKNIRQLEPSYPKGLKIFVQFLLIPLVSLYMLILYAYMGKIIGTANWPSGYVGWLVSIIAVLGMLNLLLIDPEKNKPDNGWIKTYSKGFYFLIIPLLIMLFLAVGFRVADYGVTERRYFLIALGIWLFAIAIYFLVSKRKNIKFIPISLFIVLLVTLAGPWSAFSVSKNSQLNRAITILTKYGLLKNGYVQPNIENEVSWNDEVELSKIFNYLIQNHTSKSLGTLFPNEVLSKIQSQSGENSEFYYSQSMNQNSTALMKYLGLKYRTAKESTRDEYLYFTSGINNDGIDIRAYQTIYEVQWNTNHIEVEGRRLDLEFDGDELKIKEKEQELKVVSLNDYFQTLAKENQGLGSNSLPLNRMAFELEFDRYQAKLLFKSIQLVIKGEKEIEVHSPDYYLLLRKMEK